MSSDRKNKADRVSPQTAVTRHKRRNFTDEVYGARLPFEDARVIDDYAKANKLDRSEVVRHGLHLFVLRQKMHRPKKDPLRESLEQAVAEQITPVQQCTDEMMGLLKDLAGFVVGQGQSTPLRLTIRGDGEMSPTEDNGPLLSPVERSLADQRELIEQTLMTITLGLRLLVDYFIDPVLKASEARADDDVAKRLEAAILGRERWSSATHKVVARTGKRILFESNLMTPEEWEKLLAGYREEDRKARL